MNLSIIRPSYVAFGVIAIAAAGAFAFAALRVHADTAPVFTQSVQNSSNVVVASATIGASLHDVAGLASSTSSALPTGAVDFNLYANTACAGTPTVQQNVALVNGIATSSDTVLGASGLSYTVHYRGDANNVEATSSCSAVTPTSQAVSVSNQLSTTTSVLAGSIVSDTAQLSGATAQATGTVAYTLYSNSACTAFLLNGGSQTVSNAVVPASNPIQFNFAGTYFWQSVYSGDQNNSAATSSCTTLTVTATSTPVVTPPGTTTPPVIVPGHHHDNDDNATSTKEHGDDNGNGIGQKIQDFFKSNFFKNGHDNGNHFGQIRNGNKGKGGDNDNDQGDNGNDD